MTETAMIIALTLFGEARGESLPGKMAVASVIYNRAEGDTTRMAYICMKPYQFSCWNYGAKMPTIPAADSPERKAWNDCAAIAELAATGKLKPVTEATHYHARTMKQPPKWTAGQVPCAVLDGHVFYRLTTPPERDAAANNGGDLMRDAGADAGAALPSPARFEGKKTTEGGRK